MDNARDILARTIKDLFDLLTRLNFKDMEILFSKMEIIRKNQMNIDDMNHTIAYMTSLVEEAEKSNSLEPLRAEYKKYLDDVKVYLGCEIEIRGTKLEEHIRRIEEPMKNYESKKFLEDSIMTLLGLNEEIYNLFN